jgi:hypothetical protein
MQVQLGEDAQAQKSLAVYKTKYWHAATALTSSVIKTREKTARSQSVKL